MVKRDLLPEMRTMTLRTVAQFLGGAACGGGQPQMRSHDCKTVGSVLLLLFLGFKSIALVLCVIAAK